MPVPHVGNSPKVHNFFHALHIRMQSFSWLYLTLGLRYACLNYSCHSKAFFGLLQHHVSNQLYICSVVRIEFSSTPLLIGTQSFLVFCESVQTLHAFLRESTSTAPFGQVLWKDNQFFLASLSSFSQSSVLLYASIHKLYAFCEKLHPLPCSLWPVVNRSSFPLIALPTMFHGNHGYFL